MSQASQNSTFKSRKFFLTFWIKVPGIIEHSGLNYGCQCYDQCSEEHGGKFHGHAFLYFNNPVRFSTIKKWYGENCHNEKPMKNSECIKYIMDPEHEHAKFKTDRIEIGNPPCDNGKHFTTQQALEMTDNEILDLNPRDTAMILNIKEKLKNEDMDIEDFSKTVKVYYIWGPSGAGKTERAKIIIKENGGKFSNAKFDGTFWSGIKNHKCKIILVDDFRDSQMKAAEFINLVDYNKHTMNRKNGSEINDYEIVIITSIQNPKKIYPNMKDKEPKKQWLRRMEIIKLEAQETEQSDESTEECEDCEL